MLASFFDLQNFRPYVERLRGVTIECAREREASTFDLPQALLLSGWLASSLGLQVEQRDIQDKRLTFGLLGGPNRVTLDIVISDSSSDPVTIVLKADGREADPSAEFSLALEPNSLQVAASALPSGAPQRSSTQSLRL